MNKDVKKIGRSVAFALKGLRHAFRFDRSFRMEVMYGLPAYMLVGVYLWPLSPWEILFYVLSYVLILVTELVNTAFEKMLERVHPEEHELIGRSKDIGASAVLVAFIFAIFVVVVLLVVRWNSVSGSLDMLPRV